VFQSKADDVEVNTLELLIYFLPLYKDEDEKDVFHEECFLTGNKPLPGFIKFQKDKLEIAPLLPQDSGKFKIIYKVTSLSILNG